jgi:hypothetical protein
VFDKKSLRRKQFVGLALFYLMFLSSVIITIYNNRINGGHNTLTLIDCRNLLENIDRRNLLENIIDCRNLLENIPCAMVYHVSRELNREGHDLASLAKNVGSRNWMGNAPLNLYSVTAVPASVSPLEASLS